jgi:hypothetical protein
MDFKKIYFLFFLLFGYYILIPIFLIEYSLVNDYSIESYKSIINDHHYKKKLNDYVFFSTPDIIKIYGQRLLIYKKLYNENFNYYQYLSFLLTFIFILFSRKFLKNIHLVNYKIFIKDQKEIFTLISILSLLILLKDLLEIINYYYLNDNILRENLYQLINNRKTYLTILIIISVANFSLSRKLSYICYLAVILYDLLTLSRYNIFLLAILHFFVNINLFKKKLNLIYFFLILFFIITYRLVFLNRDVFGIFSDSFDIMLGSMISFDNLKNINFQMFFIDNIKFILKDFFYLDVFNINFLQKENFPIFSARGIDSIIYHFFAFLIYIIILYFCIKNLKISSAFINSIIVFLIISLFRGNFVHNVNFIIKLYVLIFFIQWLIKILKRLNLKVV